MGYGYVQVPRGAGVIQGDGINLTSLSQILAAVLDAGYSAEVGGTFDALARPY